MALIGSEYRGAAPPSASSANPRPHRELRRCRRHSSDPARRATRISCGRRCLIAFSYGIFFTSAIAGSQEIVCPILYPARYLVSAGPSFGELYLKPPSSGGLWEGVTRMPFRAASCRARLHTRMAWEITGVGVTPSSFWMMVSTLFAARTSSAEHWPARTGRACPSPCTGGP